ncbi:fungal-specific transcription factor domain-containing protein [Bisporella sp. PMI_857]|nr:fungal-specific transcription factor domain-containing protein [Bisporella sp. PMI_857]
MSTNSKPNEISSISVDYPPLSKRRRDGQQRVRVTRACDNCKKKKGRCSGTVPCNVCIRKNLSCHYNASYNRGKVPIVPAPNASHIGTQSIYPSPENEVNVGDIEHGQSSLADVHMSSDASPGFSSTELPCQRNYLQNTDVANGNSQEISFHNSPEPPETDLEGHYVGPSSGVSFLLRVQKRLQENLLISESNSVFTFGDSQLPKLDPSFLILPSKSDAEGLVVRFFDFAFPTHRFLHQPTIDQWIEEFYDNPSIVPRSRGANDRRALILMVMAQASVYAVAGQDQTANKSTIAMYFRASEHQLEAETGPVQLTGIQARLLQCFYLLGQSRVNHCWSLFGTVARLIIAIGVHRRRRSEVPNSIDMVELECRKRVFWSAYSLDNYLSVVLGRPRIFHDDDIDQELPTVTNDNDILTSGISPATPHPQSIMLAAVHQARLSKIISGILKELYGIRRQSISAQLATSRRYDGKLNHWRQSISSFLDSTDASLLRTIFQRQHTALRLSYFHAKILLHRPFLLGNLITGIQASSTRQREEDQRMINENIDECMKAARNIVQIVHDMCEGHQMFQAFWFTHYFAFCATLVLYVYVIQHISDEQNVCKRYLEMAQQCQDDLSTVGGKDSFAQRYGIMLEIFRLEALKQAQINPRRNLGLNASSVNDNSHAPINGDHEETPVFVNIGSQRNMPARHVTAETRPEPGMENNYGRDESEGRTDNVDHYSFLEHTGWSEFDPLIAAGFGNLDSVFPQIGEDGQYIYSNGPEDLHHWNYVDHENAVMLI